MGASAARHDVFQAIADPNRREILILLAEREELPIAAITSHFPISRTAVNKHLHVLADAGLVRKRKAGRETRYSLQLEPLQQVQQWLSYFERYWDNKLAALQRYVQAFDDGENSGSDSNGSDSSGSDSSSSTAGR
jgi:DNA-binding transcriptional ArsR family regulator